MKLKQNVAIAFVCAPEQYNRVIAVYSLLMAIDKRVNKTKQISKKAAVKKQKDGIYSDSYHHGGSQKKRASAILVKNVIHNLTVTRHHDRYYHSYHSSTSFFHYQA